MPFTIAPVITRKQLQGLKEEISESKQELDLKDAERIDTFVNSVYRKVLDVAENTTERTYKNKLYSEYVSFYAKHSEEILRSLRLRLPDCDVQIKLMVYGPDGKMYESNNPLFTDKLKNSYIVIDWS